MNWRNSYLAALGVAIWGCVATEAGREVALAPVDRNPGALDMSVYVPGGLEDPAPLVVVLHGCTQDAAEIAETGWNALADRHGFSVLYPQQRPSNNFNRCFNWFEEGDIARGIGEVDSIVAMVESFPAPVDPTRVFVVGLSAGGAMTSVLLATAPDVFSAGAINAGIAFRCGIGVPNAFGCMRAAEGQNRTPDAWGDLVRAAAPPGYSGPWPRVSVWQGTADATVVPAAATEIVEQWTAVHEVDAAPARVESIGRAQRSTFGAGEVERFDVQGMGHAVALGGCGTPGQYAVEVGVCSAAWQAHFFGLVSREELMDTAPAPSEAVRDTCTGHYLAGRLDLDEYLACGKTNGFRAVVPLDPADGG